MNQAAGDDPLMTSMLNADAIQRAALLTLQNLVQLRAGPRQGALPPAAPAAAAVEVPFWGAQHGKLMVRATDGLARVIAVRLFQAAEPDRRQRQEALCLAAGAICGTMLAALHDERRSCQLENARIIENIRGYDNLFGAPQLTALVSCDEGAAELRVYLKTIGSPLGQDPQDGPG